MADLEASVVKPAPPMRWYDVFLITAPLLTLFFAARAGR